MIALCPAVFGCVLPANANTIISAESYTFWTQNPATQSPANGFELEVQGNFIGSVTSSVFSVSSIENSSNYTGTAVFSGATVSNGYSADVRFAVTGSSVGATGYFTQNGSPVGNPVTIQGKALDGTSVSWTPEFGGFAATFSVFNNSSITLQGAVSVMVNSGFPTNFNLNTFDIPNSAQLIYATSGYNFAPGQGLMNLTAFLPSNASYLEIRGVADGGDGTGPFPFSIAISPVSEVTHIPIAIGFNSIANNFNLVTNNTTNDLNEIIPVLANGTALYKFNSNSSSFQLYSTYQTGLGWMPDGTLNPGEGAFLDSSVWQTMSLSGQAPTFTTQSRLPSGSYCVSAPAPQPCDFATLMGFPPALGDQVYFFTNPASSLPPTPTGICTFGTNGWDVVPVVNPGQSVMVQLVAQPAVTLPVQSTGSLGNFTPSQNATFFTDEFFYQVGSATSTGGRTVSLNLPEGTSSVTVFDFSNINIPSGVIVTAVGNSPLVLLAKSNAVVNGIINVSGSQGGSAGLSGGPGGGGGGGVVALFANTLTIGVGGNILAVGGNSGITTTAVMPCSQGGLGGNPGPSGAAGGNGGAAIAGGAGANGGAGSSFTAFGKTVYVGCGGGGGGGGAYSGPGGIGGAGIFSGANGVAGAFGVCPTAVGGGAGGTGGASLGPLGAGGTAGVPPGGAGGAGGPGVAFSLVGGGGGGGGATLGGPGGPGGAGIGFCGGGGGGGGADTCPAVPGAQPPVRSGAGGPGGGGNIPGGTGGSGATNRLVAGGGIVYPYTNSVNQFYFPTNYVPPTFYPVNRTNYIYVVQTNYPYFVGTNLPYRPFYLTNYPPSVPKKGGAGGGGGVRVGSRTGIIQNQGFLAAGGGTGANQQGGSGGIVAYGRMQGTGRTVGLYQETYGQTTDPWILPGGSGGGGAGGDGQPNIFLGVNYSRGMVQLIWDGGGTLQTASKIQGPWTSLPTAMSPYTNSVGSTAYFRILCPCQ